MGHSVCRHIGQRHGFQPAQDAQFGFRVAEPVEDHNPQQGFDIQLPLTGAEVPHQRDHSFRFIVTAHSG